MAKQLHFSVGWLLVLLFASDAQCAEAEMPLDTFLAKWEQASADCRTLDATITVFDYNPIFRGDEPEVGRGRFYFERPNTGRFEADSFDNVIVWQDQQSLLITPSTHTVERISLSDFNALGIEPKTMFARLLCRILIPLRSPQDLLPLVVDINSSQIEQRFDVVLARLTGDYLLTAVPKNKADKAMFQKIKVIVDRETLLTNAIQMVAPSGNSRRSIVFDEVRINETPVDRHALINPDLAGYKSIGRQ